MDALLPSEIARLVLGYLQEQKCEEVAKMFLETSPHLQECRLVAQRGGRYSTKVGGLTLSDMLDKYCAANAIVQEKLNKVSDSEQIKNCNDITEQLRYLLEGSRGHRFVVNINVPTQNSPNGAFGTPILSTSSRKRQHSGSDRGKRVVKSLNNLLEKDAQASFGLNCDTVEATPLESLPGHKPSAKKLRIENHSNNLNYKSPSKIDSTQNVAKESRSNEFTSVGTQSDLNVVQHTQKHQSTETVATSNFVQSPSKSTEGTSTEQPMSYCSTEVQTAPLDLFDTEYDINSEKIANLSILTEEILHRTELAEQIAANINKSINPIQVNAHENEEAFNNAVRSAVETSDKALESLFNEIFTVSDNDSNPSRDSDARYNQGMNDGVYHENVESMDVDNNTEFTDSHNVQQSKRPDVPLKQRLRSSSRSHINPDEDEGDCNALLENQNEEAIRSIVANVMASKQGSTEESAPQVASENSSPADAQQPKYTLPSEAPSADNENVEPNKNANNAKKPRKNPRKPRTPKPKGIKIQEKAEEIKLQEQDIVTMPTLILCSQNDMQTSSISALLPAIVDGYRPIAPKPLPPSDQLPPTAPKSPKIFLRTVNVPRHLVKSSQLESSAAANQLALKLQASPRKSLTATAATCSGSPIVVIADDKQRQQQQQQQRGAESITLYGDDSNSEVRVAAPVVSMPVISLDESTCHLAAGTGLSPFFKGNVNAETTTTQMSKDTVDTKKVVAKEDAKEEAELDNDGKEKKSERIEIEKDKKAKTSKMINPTIVITAPDEDGAVSSEKENDTPEKVVVDEKTVNREKTIPEVKESKADDETVTSNSESKVNKKSIDAEKETKIVEKKDKKEEEKSISSKKDTKSEEKSVVIKNDTKPEEKSAAVKKDSKPEEKSVPTKKDSRPEEKSAAAKKDGKTEEKSAPAQKAAEPEDKPSLAKKESKPSPKPSNESKAKENARTADAIITKRTPKSLLKDRSKNNRLSLSTPRRRNSHVRALDFDEKTPEHSGTSRKAPQSCTRPKSSAVQGLFQSPPFSGETPPVAIAEPARPVRTHVSVPPIATRSPAPKLQGNWNKVAGIGLILGDSESSPEKSQSSPNLSTISEEKEPPKSWDSDLRKIVGEVNEEEADKRPKSAKKSRRRNSIKGKTIEEPKSAKKTPTTRQEQLKITPPPASLKPRIGLPAKTSPELLARIRDLQTPCKFEGLNVPPTPRVVFATPGGAGLVKIGSGKEITIKDCVNTPDFPLTPCIVVTPKIVEEEEQEKKPSPYYEPNEEAAPKEIVAGEKVVIQQTATTVAVQKKNVVELQESKSVEITKFGVIEEIKEVETTSEDNSKEIIEEESMGETNASADTTNTDSDSDSDSDSNSSTSSSSSNSSSSNSSSCSSNASSPTKSINVSHHDNSTTESEVDSPQKVINSREELERVAESSPEKEKPPAKVVTETSPAVQQLTSAISAIITSEKPAAKKSPARPKIINVQRIAPPTEMSEQLTRAAKLSLQLEEKRQRVMAKFKQTASSKRTVTVRRVTAVKKLTEAAPNAKKIVKQEPVKKAKPSPKKKVAEVKDEEVKPKNVAVASNEEVKPKNAVVVNNEEPPKPKTVAGNEKENVKAKVEQVKRDLFAPGDEAEQRTTRSQAAKKSVDENPPLPGVLECLQLIPANKSADESMLDQTVDGLSNSETNTLEVSFVYDDSVPIKKRKRNYSSSELENEYAFTFPDEDEVRVMKVIPYEEMFKMAPKTAKKKSPKKSPIKAKRKITKCPLAASSPIKKDRLQKTKSAKRKASPIKEEKQVEKKLKVEAKGGLDPAALFKKIDVDKLLKMVHK